jgi:hypothetical protein
VTYCVQSSQTKERRDCCAVGLSREWRHIHNIDSARAKKTKLLRWEAELERKFVNLAERSLGPGEHGEYWDGILRTSTGRRAKICNGEVLGIGNVPVCA